MAFHNIRKCKRINQAIRTENFFKDPTRKHEGQDIWDSRHPFIGEHDLLPVKFCGWPTVKRFKTYEGCPRIFRCRSASRGHCLGSCGASEYSWTALVHFRWCKENVQRLVHHEDNKTCRNSLSQKNQTCPTCSPGCRNEQVQERGRKLFKVDGRETRGTWEADISTTARTTTQTLRCIQQVSSILIWIPVNVAPDWNKQTWNAVLTKLHSSPLSQQIHIHHSLCNNISSSGIQFNFPKTSRSRRRCCCCSQSFGTGTSWWLNFWSTMTSQNTCSAVINDQYEPHCEKLCNEPVVCKKAKKVCHVMWIIDFVRKDKINHQTTHAHVRAPEYFVTTVYFDFSILVASTNSLAPCGLGFLRVPCRRNQLRTLVLGALREDFTSNYNLELLHEAWMLDTRSGQLVTTRQQQSHRCLKWKKFGLRLSRFVHSIWNLTRWLSLQLRTKTAKVNTMGVSKQSCHTRRQSVTDWRFSRACSCLTWPQAACGHNAVPSSQSGRWAPWGYLREVTQFNHKVLFCAHCVCSMQLHLNGIFQSIAISTLQGAAYSHFGNFHSDLESLQKPQFLSCVRKCRTCSHLSVKDGKKFCKPKAHPGWLGWRCVFLCLLIEQRSCSSTNTSEAKHLLALLAFVFVNHTNCIFGELLPQQHALSHVYNRTTQ